MQVAINTKYRYQKEKDNNKLSSDWEIVDYNHEQLETHLMAGYPITNLYNKNIDGFRRTKEYFNSASFIALDFDNKPEELTKYNANEFTVNELLKGCSFRAKFIKENAYIGYLTYSHSKENNRFRIIFKLPNPILDLNEYVTVYKAFLDKFPSADHSYIISTGFIWGAKRNSKPLKLGKDLSDSALKEVIQNINKPSKSKAIKNNNKTLTRDVVYSGKQVESIINKYLNELKNTDNGKRMEALNKVCYSIGGIIAYYVLSELEEENIKEKIREIAFELGAKTNFESFTEKDINTTIDKSLEEGKGKPLIPFDNYTNRLFKNKPKVNSFQMHQQLITGYPSPDLLSKISEQEVDEAERLQIAYFGSFGISSDSIINKTIILDVFNTLKDSEALKHYLALWKTANMTGILHFNNFDLNEVIKIMYPKANDKQMYRSRKKFIKYIQLLSSVTLFKIKKTEEPGVEDVTGIHLISNFKIRNKNRHTYLTCNLPDTFGIFGVYISDNIFKLTGKDIGAFNLAIALSKESFRINGFEHLKVNNSDYSPPVYYNPVVWEKDRVITEIRTINTFHTTRKNELLENKLIKLKEADFLRHYNIIGSKVKMCVNL